MDCPIQSTAEFDFLSMKVLFVYQVLRTLHAGAHVSARQDF